MAAQTIRCDCIKSTSWQKVQENNSPPRADQTPDTWTVDVLEQWYDLGPTYKSIESYDCYYLFDFPSLLNGKKANEVILHLYISYKSEVCDRPHDNDRFYIKTAPMVHEWSKNNYQSIINAISSSALAETNFSDFSDSKEIAIKLIYSGVSSDDRYINNIINFGIGMSHQNDWTPSPSFENQSISHHLQIDRIGTLYPPFLMFSVSDVTPRVSNMTPASGFIDIRKENVFRWTFDYDSTMVVGTLEQKAAKLRWRPAGTVSYTEISIGSAIAYRLRANTIGENVLAIEWQVIVQSIYDVWSEPSAWVTLTTQDSAPNPVPVSPINQYLNISKAITFTWKHIITTGSTQTRFDLEYSRDGAAWLAIASELTSRQTYTSSAYTFPTGPIQWRVRTYNSANVASAWSMPSTILIVGAPEAPTITSISSACRPTVRWQCADQASYELEVLRGEYAVYATGEVVSTDKVHTITEYLADGIYTLRLRVRGQQEFSAWMNASFMVATSKPNMPTVTVELIAGGAEITAVADSTVAKMYLLRDGAPIAKLGGSFSDYGCVGTHYYSVRAVSEDDSFCDTLELETTVTLPSAVIAPTDDLSRMTPLILRSGEPPKHSGGKTLVGGAQRCAGRRYALYEFSEHTDEQYSLAFTFRSRAADWRRLNELVERRKTILYRDQRDNAYFGVVTGVSFDQGTVTDFTLSVVRVDFVERVPYDPPVMT